MGSLDRLKGTVKWFDSRKGFGFIARENGGDVFVHQSSIEAVGFRTLDAGEAVEFFVSVGDDGRSSAVRVTGPGGVCIRGSRYFAGACFNCNKFGHMARDCKNDASFPGIGYCYNFRENGHFNSQCTSALKPSKLDLGSSSDLVAHVFLVDGEDIESEDDEQSGKSIESGPQKAKERRNWAELPGDILMVIFKKISEPEILLSAQFVCKSWRQLSLVPTLWRCVEMNFDPGYGCMESMTRMAVDRSEGCLEELLVEYFPTEELMCYISKRAPLLRCLRLISVCLDENILVETIRNFPLLDELVLSLCSFSEEEIEQVAHACPQLKTFALNELSYKLAYEADPDSDLEVDPDTEALAIAKHMKQLRHLQLFGNGLTSAGLSAILNNCSHLEHLDIRQCLNIDLDENLKKKCARIKVLRLPNDSTADYEFCKDDADDDELLAENDTFAPHEDYDSSFGSSDVDFGGEDDTYLCTSEYNFGYDGFFSGF